MRTIKLLLAAGFLLVLGTSAYAQVQRNETYLPKFAIKTNALYWATSTPNLGFEVGLAKKITLDVSGNYNPWKFGQNIDEAFRTAVEKGKAAGLNLAELQDRLEEIFHEKCN